MASRGLSPEAEAAVRVFEALPDAEKFEVFAILLETLGREGRPRELTDAEQEIVAKADALAAMKEAVEHLKLADPAALEVKQFDSVPVEVRDGWNSGRVIRLFGRWRSAVNELVGAERQVRRVVSTRHRKYQDPLAGLREWLKTSPDVSTVRAYGEWAKEWNAKHPDELPFLATGAAVATRVGVKWSDAVRVANGEYRASEAAHESKRRQLVNRTEYDLVGISEIQEILGLKEKAYSSQIVEKPGFPASVIARPRVRYWHRSDVEAWRDGKPFPEREHNELSGVLLDAKEVAQRLGLSPRTVSVGHARRVPPPAIRSGALNLWLAAELPSPE